MANRAERVLEQVKLQGLASEEFLTGIGEPDPKASPAKQGRLIKAALEEIKKTKGAEACQKLMRPCGYQCISDSVIETAKGFYQEANGEIETLLRLMNEKHIGGGHLHTEDGSIIGSYDTCYCGIPKQVKNLPKEYCECSAGWYERLFSEVFGKQADVKILQTILSGGDQCSFRISWPDPS